MELEFAFLLAGTGKGGGNTPHGTNGSATPNSVEQRHSMEGLQGQRLELQSHPARRPKPRVQPTSIHEAESALPVGECHPLVQAGY